MNTSQKPWDEEYQHRGRLFGGSAAHLPDLPRSSRILELGCGNGKTVSCLTAKGRSVTAIDFSPHAASLCRKACTDPGKAAILIADARKIPFKSESFDAIIASHITGHLSFKGRHQAAREVQRLLKRGGTMHFYDFSTADFRYGHGEETEAGTFLKKNGISTHYFADNEVPALFSGLFLQSLRLHRWELKVRGRVFPRAEIVAEFSRPG